MFLILDTILTQNESFNVEEKLAEIVPDVVPPAAAEVLSKESEGIVENSETLLEKEEATAVTAGVATAALVTGVAAAAAAATAAASSEKKTPKPKTSLTAKKPATTSATAKNAAPKVPTPSKFFTKLLL